MASEAQRARRRAQRELAKIVKENKGKAAGERKSILPRNLTNPAREATRRYADEVIAGNINEPEKGSLEAKSLARLASLARWGKEDAIYEAAFQKYWYHTRRDEEPDEETPEEDEDEE